MKTFLETYKVRSRTFLLYGNTDDSFCCGDLVLRYCEQYLVQLLKSRGYRRIIFYNEGANGAYCLDPESARFFFHENASLPSPGEDGNVEPTKASAGPAGLNLASMSHRSRYRPGDTPGEPFSETEPPQKTEPPQTVVYSRRNQDIHTFFSMIAPMMLEEKSHMAAVFCNLFISSLGTVNGLRDCILNSWDRNAKNNLCLLLVPETDSSKGTLIRQLDAVGLSSKFVRDHEQTGERTLNPFTCVDLALPKEDEVKNFLRRLHITGTEQRHRKVTFAQDELDNLAAEILYCSRDGTVNPQQGVPMAENMTEVTMRLQNFFDAQPGEEPVELTIDLVDQIWERPPRNREPALEKLNRPGWEPVYQMVTKALKIYQSETEKLSRKKGTPAADEPDCAIGRFSTGESAKTVRGRVPNFILLGNPGTGKTTIARLIGQILREHGVLKVGSTVEVNRENLTSRYVAGIPKATMDCVRRAEEGVLFIDEAHALGRKDGGANHDGTGKEVVSTLNAAITDPNRHFCVILAGYEDEMHKVYELDQGFRGRFRRNEVVIPDYPPELLEQILISCIQDRGCRLAPELTHSDNGIAPLHHFVDRFYRGRDRKRFRNGDAMEDLASEACAAADDGLVTEACFYNDQVNHGWFFPGEDNLSPEAILAELDGLCGMKTIKRDVHQLIDKLRGDQIRREKGLPVVEISMHMVFKGNPGTGKTTVARLIGRLYKSIGILPREHFIEASRADLVADHVGGTALKTREVVNEALGGVLFIDEAYSLNGIGGDDFGSETIATLVKEMEDHRDELVVIAAGYSREMTAFINSNPGLKSRFTKEFIFPDYTEDEMMEILGGMCRANRYSMTPGAEALARKELRAAQQEKNFGNGRDVRNLFERITANQSARIVHTNLNAEEELVLITEEDFNECED